MRLFLILLFSLFCATPPLPAQSSGMEQTAEVVIVGSDTFLRWYGQAGRTYFVQVSDPNEHLNKWVWCPVIDTGSNVEISHECGGTADKGFFRLWFSDQFTNDPDGADFDGDGLTNLQEVQLHQTNPLRADSDADGMPDGWEVFYNLDPNYVSDAFWDFDGDGRSTLQEFLDGTNPFNSDTDGDGVSDGDELAQGTDPNAAGSFVLQWHKVTRKLQYDFDEYPPPNNKGTLTKTAEWDAALNTSEMLTAKIPFPDLQTSLELIAFPATPPAAGGTNGLAASRGQSSLIPNPPCYHATMNHHRFWLRRGQAATTAFQQRAFIVTERTVDGTAQAKTFKVENLTIPANETTSNHVDVSKGFTQNFTGNTSHSESFTGRLCPLEVIQDNMPNLGVMPGNSTDLGGNRGQMMIGVGGIAYITGEPAIAQLRARFRDMPASVSVEWRLEIRSERTERGAVDDRNYPAQGYVTLAGNHDWDITATMNNELVGGNCTLRYRLDGSNAGSVTFRIRGKNPLDADGREYVTNHAKSANYPYAWAMVQHESRQGDRCYNQFNSGGDGPGGYEQPNFTGPDGWGIAQLDQPLGVTASTLEVYEWKQNVEKFFLEMDQKEAATNRFFAAVVRTFPNDPDAANPPASYTVVGTNTAYTARQLSTMILYNGAAGTQSSTLKTTDGSNNTLVFTNPWKFNPNGNPKWTFHDNQYDYAHDVIHGEVEGTFNVAE